MAKPRVFISSTFYDLKQIRLELDKFIEGLGYEPVRNEVGDIPYGKDEELQSYCYKEISKLIYLFLLLVVDMEVKQLLTNFHMNIPCPKWN